MTPKTLSLRDRCRGALRRTAIAALAGTMAFVPPAQACTSFLLRTSDGGVVYGRTMEFGFHLTSEAIVLPRQFAFTATGPGGKAGLTWALTSFASVAEVKAALAGIAIIDVAQPNLGITPPFHYTLHDTSGASIVIEPVNGAL